MDNPVTGIQLADGTMVSPRKLSAEQIQDVFSAWINAHDAKWDADDFVKALLTDHPTLQQNAIRFYFTVLRAYGKQARRTDLRNQASAELSREIDRLVEMGTLPAYLPLI